MNFRHLNRVLSISRRYLSTEIAAKPVLDLNNKLITPQYFEYFDNVLTEQNYRRSVPRDISYHFKETLKEYRELFEIVSGNGNAENNNINKDEEDFIDLVNNETIDCLERLKDCQRSLLTHAIEDDRDVNECTLEVRAGIGGKEAGIFAEELANVYMHYFHHNRWEVCYDKDQFEQIEISDSSSLQSYMFEISGHKSYQLLRHEAGIHRVQRVPKTERQGRMHTSTVSISVIPVRDNLVQVKDSDLKFDMKTSSGAGGQNVNRLFTCVRCTHIPTGLVVECQETRYQYHNKDLAIKKLKALLNQMEYDRQEKELSKQRKVQIGIASRSDKIRTYNWPQDRITDHRLGSSEMLHDVNGYIAGQHVAKMLAIDEKLEEIRRQELIQQFLIAVEKDFVKKFSKKK